MDYEVRGLNHENVWFFLGYLERNITPTQWEEARLAAIRQYSGLDAA